MKSVCSNGKAFTTVEMLVVIVCIAFIALCLVQFWYIDYLAKETASLTIKRVFGSDLDTGTIEVISHKCCMGPSVVKFCKNSDRRDQKPHTAKTLNLKVIEVDGKEFEEKTNLIPH